MELVKEGALQFEKDVVRKIMDDARQWGLESLRTDAQFLFTPPQIALACIFHYNKDIVQKFLDIKFPPGRVLSEKEGGGDAAEKLIKTVVECDRLISERLGVIRERSKEYVTGIDKKLYQCRKLLDSLELNTDTAKRKATSPDDREVKKSKSE
jgi:cyclin H